MDFMDKFKNSLFDDGFQDADYKDLMPAGVRSSAADSGMMAMAAQLLADSGYSTQRKSLGSSLGKAMMAGQNTYASNIDSGLARQATLDKLRDAKVARQQAADLRAFQTKYAGMDPMAFAKQQIVGQMGPTQAAADAIAKLTPQQAQAMMYTHLGDKLMSLGKGELAKTYYERAQYLQPRPEYGDVKTVMGPNGTPELVRFDKYGTTPAQVGGGFKPTPDMVQMDTGNGVRWVDKNQVQNGTFFGKGLAPQLVGSPDLGYTVFPGTGGGAPAATRAGSNAGGAGAAPNPAAAAPVVGATARAPNPAGAGQASNGLVIPPMGNKRSDDLRHEFENQPIVKSFDIVVPTYTSAKRAMYNDTKAGDLDLIYSIAKLVDPGSVVRESEAEMVVKTGSPAQQYLGLWNSIAKGEGRLTTQQRAELNRLIDNRFQGWKDEYQRSADYYSELSARRGVQSVDVIRPRLTSYEAPVPAGWTDEMSLKAGLIPKPKRN